LPPVQLENRKGRKERKEIENLCALCVLCGEFNPTVRVAIQKGQVIAQIENLGRIPQEDQFDKSACL